MANSKAKEAYYSNYKAQSRWKANRLKKLERELKRNPANAAQIEEAMANVAYRRKTPSNPVWSKSMIATAKILKEFSGSAPIACFSSNKKVANDAIAALHRTHDKLPEGKVDFSLGARAMGT